MVVSRTDVARVAASRGRARVAGARVAGQPYRARLGTVKDMTSTLAPFLVPPPLLPPGKPATEPEAMGLPPFGRAVALLCNAAASTGWYARRTNPTTGLGERVPDQPAILTDPDPMETPWHYKWAALEDGILYGNHFALYGDMDWRTNRPGWLAPVPAHDVWVLTDPSRPWWWEWAIGGATFTRDEVFHVPFGSRSGEILGRGVLEQYGWWLGGAVAAEDYSRDTFAAGALPPAVITSRQVQNQADATSLKSKWRELTTKREPIVFPDGTELKPVVGNAQDQQLVEARTWNAEMVANLVGVPGYKLGLSGPSMTYQNVQDADVDWVRDGVDRWARPLSAAITKWLLPAGSEAVWDYASRGRADQRTTQTILTGYVSSGILTTTEARAALERPPLPDTPTSGDNTTDDTTSGDDAPTSADDSATSGDDTTAVAGLPNTTSPSGGTD